MTDAEALMLDRLETVKGNHRKMIRADRKLLIEALDALSKGKANVVKDHIERVIESMNRADPPR